MSVGKSLHQMKWIVPVLISLKFNLQFNSKHNQVKLHKIPYTDTIQQAMNIQIHIFLIESLSFSATVMILLQTCPILKSQIRGERKLLSN